MLNRLALALVVVALALPAAAELLNPPGVFFDFSGTQGQNLTPPGVQQPAAFVAGRVVLSPSLGRLKLRGDRRVAFAGLRERRDAAFVLVLENDDTFSLRDRDGGIFTGEARQLLESRRKLDLLLFPPAGQRFAEATVAHAFGFPFVPGAVQIVEDRTRIRAKINRDGDRVKLSGRVVFLAVHDGEIVDGTVRLHLIVDLDD